MFTILWNLSTQMHLRVLIPSIFNLTFVPCRHCLGVASIYNYWNVSAESVKVAALPWCCMHLYTNCSSLHDAMGSACGCSSCIVTVEDKNTDVLRVLLCNKRTSDGQNYSMALHYRFPGYCLGYKTLEIWQYGSLHMQVCCSEYFLSALLDIGSNIHHYNYLLVCIASVYTL